VINRFVPLGPIKIVGGETVDGHRGKKTCATERRRHKAGAEILCGLLAVLMQWFHQR